MRNVVLASGIVAVAVFLALISIPPVGDYESGYLSQQVNNGHQIYLAVFQMANDFEVSRDPHLGWPGDLANAEVDPVHNLSEFAERLIRYNYFKPADLGKVFATPGIPAYDGAGPFKSENSSFKVYLARREDVPQTILLASKNFTFGSPLDQKPQPNGDKGFVLVRKGGDAVSHRSPQQALDTKLLGFMPGHSSLDDPGVETSANVWK